jgi:hypothetical protein
MYTSLLSRELRPPEDLWTVRSWGKAGGLEVKSALFC